MRFECDSCNAKYKISDEKVRGRVVRFPCRKCDHKILIDGRQGDPDVTVPAGAAYGFEEVVRKSEPASTFGHEAPTARARRPASPVRRRPSSMPPRRPAAVSRRLSSAPASSRVAVAGQHPGLALPVPDTQPKGETEIPEWHVSINDVPVGPIRLEEMAHKIDASAVSEYTLVWREGFDEWRPLATLPELMALLYERRHSGAPSRTSFSSMPPFVDSRTSITESDMPAVAPGPPPPPAPVASPEDGRMEFAPLADALQPELDSPDALGQMSQPPAPIGPAGVFQSPPHLGSYSGLPPEPDERVSVPAVPPQAALATAEPRGGMSLGILAVIIAVAVFSGVVASLAFDRFGDSLLQDLFGKSPQAAVAPAKPKPVQEPVVAAEGPAPDEVAIGETEPALESDSAGTVVEGEPVEGDAVDGEGAAGDVVGGEEADASEPKPLVEPPAPADDGPKMAPAAPRKRKFRRAPRHGLARVSQRYHGVRNCRSRTWLANLGRQPSY